MGETVVVGRREGDTGADGVMAPHNTLLLLLCRRSTDDAEDRLGQDLIK